MGGRKIRGQRTSARRSQKRRKKRGPEREKEDCPLFLPPEEGGTGTRRRKANKPVLHSGGWRMASLKKKRDILKLVKVVVY